MPNRFHLFAISLIVLATLLAYHGTFSVPLIFDDASAITHNPSIRSLWPLWPVLTPPSECTVAGRPLANLTFALNYALGGTDVRVYHASNVACHLAAALLLFGVIRRTLQATWVPMGFRTPFEQRLAGDAPAIALLVAVVWTVHPLLTVSVTYISQRTEVLMGLFYLGTIYAFIRGMNGSPRIWFSLSVASCFLGALSKEGMATAPILVLLYDRTFVAMSFREAWRRRWWFYLGLASTWILLAVLVTGLEDRAVGFGLGVPWWIYALTECRAVLHYLRLVYWPFPLVFDYGASFVTTMASAWPYVMALGTVLAAALIAFFRWPKVGFLAAAFFLILSPTSSVVPVATQPIAENRVYLPAAVAIALVVIGAYRVLARKSWGVVGISAAALACLCIQRNSVFQDKLGLWADTATKRPGNPRAHAILGEMLHAAGRLPEAKTHFQSALRLKPDYPEAHSNLGTTLYQLGDNSEARKHFEEALRLKPDYPIAHNNLGNILLQFGDIDGAVRHGEEALRLYSDERRLKPDLAETHNNLGNGRLYQGNLSAAQTHYREAVRLKPGFLQARMNLGVTLRLAGQLEESRQQLELVVQMKPDFPEARFNLGVLFEQIGRTDEAIRSFLAAIQLKPDFAEARFALGRLLARTGDLAAAKDQLEAVVRLKPEDAGARSALNQVNSALEKGKGTNPTPR